MNNKRKKWRTREPEILFPKSTVHKSQPTLVTKLFTLSSEKTQWVEGVYNISTKSNDKRQVKAMIAQGLIAVHREVVDKEQWSVSSVIVGLQVLQVKKKEDAYRCAELLLKYGRVAFKQKNKDQIQLHLIQWLVDWIHQVNVGKCWVPTRPFKKQYEEND